MNNALQTIPNAQLKEIPQITLKEEKPKEKNVLLFLLVLFLSNLVLD